MSPQATPKSYDRATVLRLAAGLAAMPFGSVGAADAAPAMSTWSADDLRKLHHPSLRDRTIIITGASRGFGWYMAQELLRAGAKVTLTGRSAESLASVRQQAEQIAGPGRCITVAADVTKADDCRRTIDETLAAFGHLEVLINNAGRGPQEFDVDTDDNNAKFWEVPDEVFRAIMDTNTMGVFLMSKAAVPHMLKRRFGKIISLSTSLPNMVRAGNSTYGGSKAALEASHRAWAAELKGTGVDVNILLPGGGADTSFISTKKYQGKVGERGSRTGGLLPGDIIVPAAVWLCTDATNGRNGERVIAKFWDTKLQPEKAFEACVQPHIAVPSIM